MTKPIPKTRHHLQKLTRRIQKLEALKPFSSPSSGTGVRAAAREMGNKHRLQKKVKDLKYERALVQAGLLEIEQLGQEVIYKLTNDGVIQALKDRISLERNKIFDGYCLVIFDIPEDVRKTRLRFRRFLKSVGFSQRQQSVWESDKDVGEDMQQLIERLELTEWVSVIVGQFVPSKVDPAGSYLDSGSGLQIDQETTSDSRPSTATLLQCSTADQKPISL